MRPEQFSQVADLFADAALLLRPDGQILAANRATEQLGFCWRELPLRNLCELTTASADVVRDYLARCARSGQPVFGALELVTNNGRSVACRCFGAVDRQADHPPQVLLRLVAKTASPSQFAVLNQKIEALTEEIRRRRLAEERQRKQSELLKVTLASIGDAVITTDSGGRVTFLNPVAETLTGWPLRDAQGRPLEEIFEIINEYTRLPVENPVTKVLREGAIVGLANHTLLISQDGTERPIDDSASPIRDSEGRLEGVVLVFRDVSDQKAAQRAVQEQAGILTSILAASVDHIYVIDRDGRYRFVSTGGARMLGLRPAEMIGKQWRELGLPAETMERFDAQRRHVLRTGVAAVNETVFLAPDGDVRHFEYVITPIAADATQAEMVVVVSRDTTERQRAEAARYENENRLRLALEAGQMGTWSWDVRSDQMRGSPQLEAMHGLEPGAFPATFERFQEAIHPEDRQEVLASIQQAVLTGAEHHSEYRLVLPNGDIRWVESRATVFRDASQQPLQMIGVCVETTQRKRTEHDLRFLAEASQSLSTLVDFTSALQRIASLAVPHFADWCSVCLPDETGMLQQLAVAHVDPAKVRLAEAARQRWPPDPDAPGGVYQAFRTGRSVLVQETSEPMLRQAIKDEEHFQLLTQLGLKSYMCVPLQVRGKTIGVINFVAAESGRRYTAADLALAEDLARRAAIASENAQLYASLREEARRKDEFLAMLAHELRNPLAPIRSGLDVLAILGTDPEILNTMQRQVEHLVRLVDDLLDVSRIMRGRIELRQESAELQAIAQRAVDSVLPLVEQHHQQLTVSMPPEPIRFQADAVRLTQVIGNLLNNASKYTPDGGRIELRAEAHPEQLTIVVRDSGIGIAPEVLPQIFELFTQDQRTIDRSQGGLGIGLTVVRSLIEMHGGTVDAYSEGSGRGSEFTVRLPIRREWSETAERTPVITAGMSSVAAMKILVVDDNVPAAEMLRRLLQNLGPHQVYLAHDGVAALAAAKQHVPELILLDIGLPLLDGFEVARQLRQDRQFDRVKVVAVTGYGTAADRRRSFDAGFDEHLVKPPAIAALQQILSLATAGRASGGGN
jgi:PAS domain S-box-containing protein